MEITEHNIDEVDLAKGGGLVPAIVQDSQTRMVLMQGYMNREAIEATLNTGKVTFFSRSKNRLWTKGETSKNYLHLISILADCDRDSLLVQAQPDGPTCHTGADTCWDQSN
ncbi:MAG: phosphoribosyl-AMP cyclohydrolase, partial [Bacteroidota bacterium]